MTPFGTTSTTKLNKLQPTVTNLKPKSLLYKQPSLVSAVARMRDTLFNYREAKDQKFSRNEGTVVNQHMNAMPVAVSNCTQWFSEQLPRSLSMSTVMPADAHAAANISVEVTCMWVNTCLLN